ncbi:2977_t:CDS:2, partial [Funneliformis caledonium]
NDDNEERIGATPRNYVDKPVEIVSQRTMKMTTNAYDDDVEQIDATPVELCHRRENMMTITLSK